MSLDGMGGVAPFITLIIPAYNEASRLPNTLNSLDAFLATKPGVIDASAVEVLVVDNNSRDNTFDIACQFASTHSYVRALREPRQGKGAAVQTGMLAGRGDILMFCDADLAMPFDELPKFLPPQRQGYQIAMASREVPGSVRHNEPASRHLQGRIGTFLTRLVLGLNFEDTQCGYKAFRRDVAHDLFKTQTLRGWGFDFELLYIARKRGYSVVEVPIHWYYQTESKVRPGIDTLKTLRELLRVRVNGMRGLYG